MALYLLWFRLRTVRIRHHHLLLMVYYRFVASWPLDYHYTASHYWSTCGIVVRTSDLQPRGRRFESLGKMFTHVCLCSPSSTNWYRRKLGAKQALHVTHGPMSVEFHLGWCLAEGYRNGDQCHPVGLCGLGRT